MNLHAQLLVETLRGNEFEQAIGWLRTDTGVEDRKQLCCLGVACEIYRQQTGNSVWELVGDEWYFLGETSVLPIAVANWFKMVDTEGSFLNDGAVNGLLDANDKGYSFAQIADMVESHSSEIFYE